MKCPSCGSELLVRPSYADNCVLVYCSRGECKSEAANNGAFATTESEAFDNLEMAIETEEENNNKATK